MRLATKGEAETHPRLSLEKHPDAEGAPIEHYLDKLDYFIKNIGGED